MSEYLESGSDEVVDDDIMGGVNDNDFINNFVEPEERHEDKPKRKVAPKAEIPKEVMIAMREQKEANAILQSEVAQLKQRQELNSGEINRSRNIHAVEGVEADIDKVVNNEENRRIFEAMGKGNEMREILKKAMESEFDRTTMLPDPQMMLDSLMSPYFKKDFIQRADLKSQNNQDIYGTGRDSRSEIIGRRRDLTTSEGVEAKEEDIRKEYLRKTG